MDDDQTCRDHVLLLGMEQAFRGVTYTGVQTRDWRPQMDRVLDYVRRNDFVIEDLRQENQRLRAELAECKRDAERYRWLRAQHWATSNLTAVRNPQQALRLGSDCPSGERLDALIDAALAAKEE